LRVVLKLLDLAANVVTPQYKI